MLRLASYNIRKAIAFTLPTNGGEAGMLIVAILLGIILPITAVQILWVNMVTSVTLALALVFEKPESDIMLRPPRKPTEPLLSRWLEHADRRADDDPVLHVRGRA